ncbi:MoaD/ThiS family protein [Nocardioides sp. dk4132]|nr:MoaD/ThiS family protein [Nocardioides sp. dk4132]QGA09827.1 MoaD/ThiS family protein [Nocardioides sp. dk884]
MRIRYWAAARAAAGVAEEELRVEGPVRLGEVVRELVSRHENSRLRDVIASCSVLLGEQPVGSRDPDDVVVAPGTSVEFLPPFAGG